MKRLLVYKFIKEEEKKKTPESMTTEAHLHLQYVDGYLITRSHHAAFVFFVFLKRKGLILHEEIEKETVKRCY